MRDLEARYKRKGHLVGVTDREETFIWKMRKRNQEGTIDPLVKERLDKIGLAWTKKGEDLRYDSVWEMRFTQVQAYLHECSSDVPPVSQWKSKTLAYWVRLQFYEWKRRTLQQQQRFLSLGIQPGPSRKDHWSKQYERA